MIITSSSEQVGIFVSSLSNHGEVVERLEEELEGRSADRVPLPAVQHDVVQRVRTVNRLWMSISDRQSFHHVLIRHALTHAHTNSHLYWRGVRQSAVPL